MLDLKLLRTCIIYLCFCISLLYCLFQIFIFIDDVQSQVKMEMPLPILQISTLPPVILSSDVIQGNTADLQLPTNLELVSVSVKLGSGLCRPRLWVERWDTQPPPAGVDPLALMLAILPETSVRYNPRSLSIICFLPFPPFSFLSLNSALTQSRKPEQEIIFLLDRSGSMNGNPTRQLMFTMFHALKFIPSRSLFNIVCFGSSHHSLFPDSVSPTFENLHAARRSILPLLICILQLPHCLLF